MVDTLSYTSNLPRFTMLQTLLNGPRGVMTTAPGNRRFGRKAQSLKVKPRMEGDRNSWTGTMGSHYWSIMTAWSIATVLLLILAVAFLVSVERSQPKAPSGSFYSDGQQTNLSLGSALYSSIPSTQITFIASFSSTLATAVLPAMMALFSYTAALAGTEDSDAENQQRLPSPFQLELLISALNGSVLALWSFATYVLSRRRTNVAVVPNLWSAMTIFSTLALLAYESFLSGCCGF